MDYDSFDIHIGKTPGADTFIMTVLSSNRTPLPGFLPISYADEDATLRERIVFNEEGLLAQEDDVKALGKILRERLLPDGVWAYFSQSRQEVISAQGIRRGLRIRLAIDPEASVLNQLPWEYLFDDLEQNTFIGLNDQTPIVRFMPTGLTLRKLETPRPKLLVAVASPKNEKLAQLYELGIRKTLEDTFKRLEDFVDYELMFHTSLTKLTLKLENHYDIFQFMGHGQATPGMGARIFLEKADREQELVEHGTLVNLLQTKVKLCVLTACESAVFDPGNMFTGLAQSLVQAQIPAVIGMQLKIDQQAASDFTYHFYRALVAGSPVDEAVIKSRRLAYAAAAANRAKTSSWGIPVLYLQSKDGKIWPDQSAEESIEATRALVERRNVVLEEPQEARPKQIDDLLEALSTLNFDLQLNAFRAVRSASRTGAIVLSGGGTAEEDGLNWLRNVLIRDVRWKSGKGHRCVNLKSRVTAGNTNLLWNEVALGCKVAPGNRAEIAKATVEQLATHSMIFVVEYGRRVHLDTLMADFWAKMIQAAERLPKNECLKQTSLLLLILDESDELPDSPHDLLTHLPAIEPISESTFMTWHRASERLLPDNMRDSDAARHILFGGQNGYLLSETEGYVDDILMNIDVMCQGILAYIGK